MSSPGGWDEEIVIKITAEGAKEADDAFKRVRKSISDAKKDAAQSPFKGFDANAQLNAKNFATGVKGVGDAAKKTATSLSDAGRAIRLFRTLVIASGLEKFVSNIVTTTDALTNLQAKIRVVSDSQTEANYVFSQVRDVANRTYSAISDVATVYSRTARSVKDMGVTTSATLRFTENLNKAVAIGGSTSIEASQAMIQLSQGLASGALKGDELRSVLEQLPVVSKIIASSMGKSVGDLRKLGEQGKLTTEVVFNAISSATRKVDEDFEKLPITFEKGWTVFKNEAVAASAAFQPLVTEMAKGLVGLADSFKYLGAVMKVFIEDYNGLKIAKVVGDIATLGAFSNGLSSAEKRAYDRNAPDPFMGTSARNKREGDVYDGIQGELQFQKDLAELAKQDKQRQDAMAPQPKWKPPTKTPRQEGGLTFDELVLKMGREQEIASLAEPEKGVMKEVFAKLGELKKSVREAMVLDAGNPNGGGAKLQQLQAMVEAEHEMISAQRIQLELEQELYDMEQEAIEAQIRAGQHESDNVIKTREKAEATARAFEAALNPLTAYNNAVLDANTYIHDHQELLQKQPDLYDQIARSVAALNPMYKAFVDMGQQLGQSIADAAANAIVFGDNLSNAFEQIAKAAGAQLISQFIQLGVGSLGSLMGGAPIPGITGNSPTLSGPKIGSGAVGGYFGPGGYTGNGHIGDVAGVVHGKEFVVNSNATARNRATLEAMNAGKSVGGSGATVNVHNYAGAEVQTSTNDKGEIEVMIRKAIAEQAPGVIAGDIRNANSRTAKAMNQVYESRRRT